MLLHRLLFGLLLLSRAVGSPFRFGGVYSTEGKTATMVEAQRGYEVYFDMVNAENNGRGFLLKGKPGTKEFYFRYQFITRDNRDDAAIHAEQMNELIKEEKIHFNGGSHPSYAAEEMRIADEGGVLNYQCCVGPDELYEQGRRHVFGVPVSNRKYTKNTIRTLSLQKVGAMMIVYEESNQFTRSTCEAALQYLDEVEEVQRLSGDHVIRHFKEHDVHDNDTFFKEVAMEAKERGLEAVIACVFPPEGEKLVNAFHDIKHPLKAFFATTGPTKKDWVDSFTPKWRANDILSAAQWHRDMKYPDAFFGSTQKYNEIYEKKYSGTHPTYNAAAASAVGLTLTQAIKNAFARCDISKTEGDADVLLYDPDAIECDDADDLGTRGYDRVLNALAELDMETFFGRVKFNYFQRNDGLDPVTTQIRERRSDNGTLIRYIEAVLPLGYATQLMRYPAENRYQEDCKPGYYVGEDAFDPCQPCQPGEASHETNADHCDSCPIGEWMDKKAQSKCKLCPEGTHTEIRGATKNADCICKPGFFNVAQQPGVECQKCLEGATCAGGTELPVPLPGYWTTPTRRTDIYQCDPPSVCEGGANVTCAEGHEGRLCSQCSRGYFSAVQDCHSCLHPALILFLLFFLLFSWYFINVTISRSVASLEMILGWAQLANIVGDVNLNWPRKVTTMFGVANILDFDVDILEPSCLISWGFRENMITQLLLPIFMSILAFLGFLAAIVAYKLLKHKYIRNGGKRNRVLAVFVVVPENKDQLKEKWDATVATFLSSVDVTYVTIAKYCFDVFKCENIAGESVLREDPSVVCSTQAHTVLIVLAYLGIVGYVIFYPAFVVWKIGHLQHQKAFSDAVHIRQFGFVYKKYELDYSFTPVIIIFRKLSFVLVLVFMNNPAFQVGTLAVIIIASLMIHVYTTPYVDTSMDVLFSFLLIALTFEAFGGLMFYSDNLPEKYRRILEWIVIGALLLLSAAFLAIFFREIMTKYRARYVKKQHKRYHKGLHPFGSFSNFSRRGLTQPSSVSDICEGSVLSMGSSFKEPPISHELLETFDPGIVYKTLQKNPSFIEKWDTLTTILKDFVSDQSETSYLSMNPIAKFWRKLVDRFPELVDFLAVANEATRRKFKDVATNLYQNFYMAKKMAPLPMMKIINWRDRAPLAQWLAIAPPNDRSFFLECVSQMFKVNNMEVEAILKDKLKTGGYDPTLVERWKNRKGLFTRLMSRAVENPEDSDPFCHSASLAAADRSISSNYRESSAECSYKASLTPSTSEISLTRMPPDRNLGASSSSEWTDVNQGSMSDIHSRDRSYHTQTSSSSQNNKSVCFAGPDGPLDSC